MHHTARRNPVKSLLRITALALLAGGLAGALEAQTLTFGRRAYLGSYTYTHIDLNNDGREDLVYPTEVPGHRGFGVVLSNGNGTYAAPVLYTSPDNFPQSIVLIDINNDGYPDLFAWSGAILSNGQYAFYEYLNDKRGGFHLQASYRVTGALTGLAVGDFNHDGYLDLTYLTEATSSRGQIHVWFNNHASGFSAGPVTNTYSYGQIAVGDFDGDGKADIFIQGGDAAYPSGIGYGDNAGHFSEQINAHTAHSPILFPMDIDGDGKTDLVGGATKYDPNTQQYISFKDLFVIYGTANRTVTERAIPLDYYPVPIYTESGFHEPVADQADFNGDGKADLVVVEDTQANGQGTTRRIVVLTSKGNRAFNPEEVLYTDNSGNLDFTVQAIHANSDNKPDILADTFGNNKRTALFFLNDTSGWFGGCPLPASASGIHLCSPTTYTSTKAAFSLSATGVPLMHRMELWVDGAKKYQQFTRAYSHATFLDTTLTLPAGTHRVTVFAAGQDNSLQRKTYNIIVK
jgi:hypothetical protein